MGTKVLRGVSNICVAVLATVVVCITVQNISAVFDGSYHDVLQAWCRNWAVAVLAIAGMFVVTTSVQRRWLRIKLVTTSGLLGMIAFAFFGLVMVIYSFEVGAYGKGLFQGWATIVGAFAILMITSYINKTIRYGENA